METVTIIFQFTNYLFSYVQSVSEPFCWVLISMTVFHNNVAAFQINLFFFIFLYIFVIIFSL